MTNFEKLTLIYEREQENVSLLVTSFMFMFFMFGVAGIPSRSMADIICAVLFELSMITCLTGLRNVIVYNYKKNKAMLKDFIKERHN